MKSKLNGRIGIVEAAGEAADAGDIEFVDVAVAVTPFGDVLDALMPGATVPGEVDGMASGCANPVALLGELKVGDAADAADG